jgi:penicillin amidase
MLSSDMHLSHGVPGIWYMASLESGAFHVSGVTLPGTPFVIVGHNQHIAWGFTNLGADVQDLLIEQTRGEGSSAEFQAADGSWHPLLHQREVIHVKGGSDVVLDIAATQHGNMATPIISGMYPHEKRSIALRWSIYDPANITSPFYGVNSASDWQSLRTAISGFGGPSQNLMYADDQGHIGYHGIGRIPVRGSMSAPTPLSPLPVDGRDPSHDWAGYIPFDQMPQSYDPPGGIVATANARITPDGYPFPVTLDWAAPYRNERIWKVLGAKTGLVPADMLALQTDVYSDLDKVIAQRLAYAIDHSTKAHTAPDSNQAKRLRQAADLMRVWDGTVEADSAAPAIVDAARAALWPMLLEPQLSAPANSTQETKTTPQAAEEVALYNWGEKSYAEEQIIVHAPSRWLPVRYADWNELLTAAVERGLVNEKAPGDLSKWRYGRVHPVDIEHPIFSQSPLLGRILGMRTGTGVQPQSGDGSTVKQVGRKFGPSERLTVDFSNLENSTLNVVLGESANPASEWFMDQWPAWYHGTTFPMPFSEAATNAAAQHTLTLVP